MTDSEAGEDAKGLLKLGACLLCYRKCLPHDKRSLCCAFIITLQHTVQQVDKAFVSQPLLFELLLLVCCVGTWSGILIPSD